MQATFLQCKESAATVHRLFSLLPISQHSHSPELAPFLSRPSWSVFRAHAWPLRSPKDRSACVLSHQGCCLHLNFVWRYFHQNNNLNWFLYLRPLALKTIWFDTKSRFLQEKKNKRPRIKTIAVSFLNKRNFTHWVLDSISNGKHLNRFSKYLNVPAKDFPQNLFSLLFASEMKYDFIKQKREALEPELYLGCTCVYAHPAAHMCTHSHTHMHACQ